jgi:hypothetical protein
MYTMKKFAIVIAVGAAFLAFTATALAALSVTGSSGLSVNNNGCTDKVGSGKAYIVCPSYTSTVIQWSTPYSKSHVALRGYCASNAQWNNHVHIVKYWREGGRDRVNVKFTGRSNCVITSVVFS